MAGPITTPGPKLVRRLRAEALQVSWELRYLAQEASAPLPAGWREAAACSRYGWEWFNLDARLAVPICERCPVRLECLRDARRAEDEIAAHHVSHVAGGLTAPVRRRLQKELRP